MTTSVVASSRRTPLIELCRWMLLVGLGLLFVIGLSLNLRRIVQAEVSPLDPIATLLLVAMFVSSTALIRSLCTGYAASDASALERWTVLLLPTGGLLLLGLALSTPGTSVVVLGLLWLAIVGEESLMLWRSRRVGQRRRSDHIAAPPLQPNDGEQLPSDATQSIIRRVAVDGTESITGTLRAKFQPGQRTTYVHIGFCPPLASVPTIVAEQTDGPEAEIKLAQTLPHGARFDVRLKRSNNEQVVLKFDFHATMSPST